MSYLLNSADFPKLSELLTEMNLSFPKSKDTFNEALQAWIKRNNEDKQLLHELSLFAGSILKLVNFENAFTDYGINSNRGFFQEVYIRIKHQILPVKLKPDELKAVLSEHVLESIYVKSLELISVSSWIQIFALINPEKINQEEKDKFALEISGALTILSHRLTSIAIDPYFVSRIQESDDLDSPFFKLNGAVAFLAESNSLISNGINEKEFQDISVHIQSCDEILEKMERNEKLNGTSLHLIFLSKLAAQQLKRIKLLLGLMAKFNREYCIESQAVLTRMVIPAVGKSNRLVKFLKANTQMLAHRVVNHTSEKGEHYVGFTRRENKKLFLSSMGGGLMVVLMVFMKHLIHSLHLSLFFEGLLFGLNYAAGFVTMHLLHFTLATKQPAMTASYIASGLDPDNLKSEQSRKVFRFVISSQFISLIGNLIVVLPLCLLIGYLAFQLGEVSVFTHTESKNALYSNHPLLSLSLIYAVITAFFLSATGIITGLIDNKIQFSEVPYRIINHPVLKQRFSKEKLKKIALFVEKNGGAISGNIFLGLSLGMAGNIGDFIGLPFDIRHVTISAGYFGFASSSGWSFETDLLVTVFIGVILIGLINVIASFLISFGLACKSRNISVLGALKILVYSSRKK